MRHLTKPFDNMPELGGADKLMGAAKVKENLTW